MDLLNEVKGMKRVQEQSDPSGRVDKKPMLAKQQYREMEDMFLRHRHRIMQYILFICKSCPALPENIQCPAPGLNSDKAL